MKTLTLTLFLCLAPVVTLLADVVEVPNDLPTIEALISLHKLIKGEEDKALAQVTASYGSQSLVTKGATKFNAARSTLDSKLSNAYSYVILASALAATGTNLYKLIRDYTQFTAATTQSAFRKPMVAWYYTEACYACAREVRLIQQQYLTLSASGLNVLKASMDEKLDLIYSLKASIDRMEGIISQAYTWCSIVTVGGFHYDYIWDILNSEVTDGIAREVITRWNAS